MKKMLPLVLLVGLGVFLPTEAVYADGPSQKKLMELVALTSVVTLVGIGFTLITGALLTSRLLCPSPSVASSIER